MFEYKISRQVYTPDFTLILLSMMYAIMVIASIVLFDEIIEFSFFSFKMTLSGALIPYVFLYPISFIILRVYGVKYVSYMIGSMLLASLTFVILSALVTKASMSSTELHSILSSSFKMYLAGFVGMPMGIYASFLALSTLINKLKLRFGIISLSIATFVGEIINTLIVFPIGFYGKYTFNGLLNSIIFDALAFKLISGPILAILAIFVIQSIANKESSKIL